MGVESALFFYVKKKTLHETPARNSALSLSPVLRCLPSAWHHRFLKSAHSSGGKTPRGSPLPHGRFHPDRLIQITEARRRTETRFHLWRRRRSSDSGVLHAGSEVDTLHRDRR